MRSRTEGLILLPYAEDQESAEGHKSTAHVSDVARLRLLRPTKLLRGRFFAVQV